MTRDSKIEKVLITGGAGFIGSNFIRHFLENHPETKVVNLDKLTYCGNLENLADVEKSPRYKFVKGDICDGKIVEPFMKDADAVIHFAAESHVDNSIKDPFVFTKTNVLGTHTLLEAAHKCGVKKFLHISTDEVYGSILEGSFKETDRLNPTSPYSASKASAELIAQGFYRTFGLPLVIVRLSNNFGPYQYPEKIIPLFVTSLLEGKKVPLMGKGENRRDWIYVLDSVDAIDFVFTNGEIGEIYNIPGSCELSNMETTKILLALLEKDESYIQEILHRLGHDFRYSMDGTKLFNLGWRPSQPKEEAFRKTVEWYKENEPWWRKLKNKLSAP